MKKHELELIKRKARKDKYCSGCGNKILCEEYYFSEELKNKLINRINKKFCQTCVKFNGAEPHKQA